MQVRPSEQTKKRRAFLMDHSVLTILDLGIIAAYLVIMVLVGVYSVRRIQNTKDIM